MLRRVLPVLALIGASIVGAAPARALDPERRLSQYSHTAWRIEDGSFIGTPIGITQTTDGYLWIGTNVGLVRFDGEHFLPWMPPPGKRMLDGRVFSLQGTRDGSLWVGTGTSVSHLKNGELENYGEPRGRYEGILEDASGKVWAVRTQVETGDNQGPLCRFGDGNYRCYNKADGVSLATATHLVADAAGNLWLGGFNGVCRWKPGSSSTYFSHNASVDVGLGTVRSLAAAPDGTLWASIEHAGKVLQLEHYVNGRWVTRSFPGIPVADAELMTLFVDRGGALWLGTAHHGIFRVQGEDIDHFDRIDGLSSDAIGSFFEDREGTMWVVTAEGIDNFRDQRVATYAMREGLSAAGASSLAVGHDGTVWVGNFEALNFVRNNKVMAIRESEGLPGRNVTTVFEDHAGRLWAGVDSGLWVYDGGKFHAVLHPDGSKTGTVFSIVEDVNHNIWARTESPQELVRIEGTTVREEMSSPLISKSFMMASNPLGGVVLALVNGDLIKLRDGKMEISTPATAADAQHVRDLLVEQDGSVWATTTEQVIRWKDGRRDSMTTRNGFPCDGVYALVKDAHGAFWFFTRCGLVRIAAEEMERWWQHPSSRVDYTLIGAEDGVQPGLTSLKPQAARTPDGRLWFVNNRILQMIDPDQGHRNLDPPPVHIQQIVADRATYPPTQNLHLPPLTRDLEIDYAALSFVAPQKVRYRYRLDGRDADWQDPQTRRQAFYSDLQPGRYRFRVIACNNEGVWNTIGDAWSFVVEPAWYQTGWFRMAMVALIVLALWLIYRLRMWTMRERINARFDERMAERTRLARELHDTLLQTIQGSRIVADDALDHPNDMDRMRRALERLSGWLSQATDEGRAALNSLRTSTTNVNDLAEAFERAARECSAKTAMEFGIVVEGAVREMHPIVRDEVYRIGYEAIRNACMHSAGTRLEVDLHYARNLVLRVRDNGKGIHPDVAAAGKDGHFGLKGMQERATRVGGSLTLSSSAYSGTEVELTIPGNIVFSETRAPRGGIRSGWKKLFPRRNPETREQ